MSILSPRRLLRFVPFRLLAGGLLLGVMSLGFTSTAQADLVWTPDGGWKVEGGFLGPLFSDTGTSKSALEAMNKAKTAQDAGRYWSALSQYDQVISDFPGSIFAPEAYFQEGLIYIQRHQFEKAFDTFDHIIKRYPDYPNFNGVVRQEFRVGDLMTTDRPYLWGWVPWFKNPLKAPEYYDTVVKNAPASEFAPMALMKSSMVYLGHTGPFDNGESAAKAIDALKRLVNDYPQSMLASDGYLELSDIYSSLVIGPPYDQASTRQAIRYLEDYLFYYKESADAASVEKKRDNLLDVYARSQLQLGDFFYYYRNSNRAALIFYNQAVTIAPNSPAANEARTQIDKIRQHIPAPMTPYDMVFGRYNDHALSAAEEQGRIEKLAADAFTQKSPSDFVETPGDEVVETVSSSGQAQTYQGFEPFLPAPGGPASPVPSSGSSAPLPVQGATPPPAEPPAAPLFR